jgi:hypothetical protein
LAKDRDSLAADLQTGDGLLSGVLAEENEFDRRMLWRLGSWGFAAVAAVAVAVIANQSSLTLRRDRVAAVDLGRQAQQLQTLAKESHNETRRLASAIDTLNSDRDRLYSRVTTLEQSLDSVTGAIAKQAAPPVALPSGAPTPATRPTTANPQPTQSAALAPAVAPVATAQTVPSDKPAAPDKAAAPAEKPFVATEKPVAADKKSSPATKPQAAPERPTAATLENASATAASASAVIASPAGATMPAGPDDGKPSTPNPAELSVADRSLIGPPAPADSGLVESAKAATPAPVAQVATAAPTGVAVTDDAGVPKVQIQHTEFGVDLGTANSVNGLRALWRGLLRSRANARLATLAPIIVIKENTNGLGMQLRLVAGPLNDAGAAAKICAELSLSQRTCETAVYDGQRLALKPEEPPAATRPVRRRVAPKHVSAPPAQQGPPQSPVVEERKPEPSTFSIFRRNSQ